MDSYNKIINLKLEDLEDKDISSSLEYFFNLTLEEQETDFLEKFKIAIKKYAETLLDNVDIYPVSNSYNNNIYRIDRLLYIAKELYGYNNLNEFNFRKNFELSDDKSYQSSLERYPNRVHNGIISDYDVIKNLTFYKTQKDFISKYARKDESLLKDAFYTYFTLDNYFDKENNLTRRNKFIKKHNIDFKILKDYVIAYGLLYLKMPLSKLDSMITSIDIIVKRDTTMNIFRLEKILIKIEKSTDLNEIIEIVYKNHISLYAVNYLFENLRYFKKEHNKDLICKKVSQALKKLESKNKYIHYSIVLSKIEKTNDDEEILILVSNNIKMIKDICINRFIISYRSTLSSNEKEKLRETLTKKINTAKKTIQEGNNKIKLSQRKEKQQTIANQINFRLFLNEEITSIEYFCQLNNINRDEFNEGLEYLKITDNSLYTQITTKINNFKGKRYAVLANKVNKIADSITNGIKEDDNTTRQFQILDYFLTTKLDFDDFVNIYISSNSSDKDTLQKIKLFFKKNKLENKVNIKTELNGKTIFMIDNSPYEVKEEEKKEVIRFLQDRNIPLYTKIYKQALKRHINGNLISEDKKKVYKKN